MHLWILCNPKALVINGYYRDKVHLTLRRVLVHSSMDSPSGSTSETEEGFSTRMADTVTSGFILAGLSIGVKLGLFEAMAKADTPLTSHELADHTKCKERYVREWLHHMVMCDVIEVDVSGKNFSLPAHRHKALTDKMARVPTFGPVLPVMLIPHKEVLSCFHKDGPQGLPFSTVLPVFEELNNTFYKEASLKKCAESICNAVPGLRDKLDSGIRVLEVGSGNGVMLFNLARQFPKSSFVGIEISPDLLACALENKAANGDDNVEMLLQDATDLPESWHNTFDHVFMRDVLHDIAHASKALENIHSCLKPGCILSLFEINIDSNPYKAHLDDKQKKTGQFCYMISTYHCLPASMHQPGSQGLGAGSGIQHLTQLAVQAGLQPLGEPQPADWTNVHLMFTKSAK